MADLIDNPVINSPFEEPKQHFRFDDNGITDEIVPGRCLSASTAAMQAQQYIVPLFQRFYVWDRPYWNTL